MPTDKEELWTFAPVNPDVAGASGKLSDLFRNEGVEPRGHLIQGAPSTDATLMAREVIQNSWDAAQELQVDDPSVPPFALDFAFKEVKGDVKESLIQALGLRQLSAHAAVAVSRPDSKPEDRNAKLGLGTGDCLADLDERDAISFCEIVERGAKGMYGPWEGAKSRMFLAMLSVGYNQKADGSGGTFGFGKAGLIRASHPRVVVAYSCFPEQANDPGVTRRLLGVTYWGPHEDASGVELTGFARFGNRESADRVLPYTNDEADSVALSLGLEIRSAAEATQLGTTFLVLDPAVHPEELQEAVERSWWPALLDEKFTVTVSAPDGTEQICRPKKNEQLDAYIHAYEQLQAGGTGDPNVRIRDLGQYRAPDGETRLLGKLALIADPDGWSFPDELGGPDATIDNRSLVALTREPRMVVEYHLPGRDISRRTPYVRGVFVGDPQVNALLGRTEPKAHDKWDSQPSDDVVPSATAIAGRILDLVKRHVKEFQDELRPPVDDSGATRLQRLDDKLKKLRDPGGTTPPPIPQGDRPYSFALNVRREVRGTQLVLAGSVGVSLSQSAPAPSIESRIRIAFAILEDGRRGDSVPLTVTSPAGFIEIAGDSTRFEGIVTSEPVSFEIESDPYRDDWTGELLVSGELITDGTKDLE